MTDEFLEDCLTEFPRRLRRIRMQQGLTQLELAHRLGIQQTGVSRFESGKRSPTMRSIVRLVLALDVSADQLLGT